MRLQALALFDAGTLALRLNGLSGAVGAALDNGARFHFRSLKADDAGHRRRADGDVAQQHV
jgi:hypothetical protein